MRSVEAIKAEIDLLERARGLASELNKLIHESYTVSRVKVSCDGPFTKVHHQASWMVNKLIDAQMAVRVEHNEAEEV